MTSPVSYDVKYVVQLVHLQRFRVAHYWKLSSAVGQRTLPYQIRRLEGLKSEFSGIWYIAKCNVVS